MLSEKEIEGLLKTTKEEHGQLTRAYKNNPPRSLTDGKEKFEKIKECMIKVSLLYKILGKKDLSERTESNIDIILKSMKDSSWKK